MTDQKLSLAYAEKASDLATEADNANVRKHAAGMRSRSAAYAIASGVAHFQECVEAGFITGKPYDGALSVLVALENAGLTIVRKRS